MQKREENEEEEAGNRSSNRIRRLLRRIFVDPLRSRVLFTRNSLVNQTRTSNSFPSDRFSLLQSKRDFRREIFLVEMFYVTEHKTKNKKKASMFRTSGGSPV